MKVLMILGHDPIYPYEDGRVIKEAQSIISLGHEVTIMNFSNIKKEEIYNKIKIKRVCPIEQPKNIVSKTIKKILTLIFFIRKILGTEIDVIHTHDFETLPYGVLTKLIKRKKLIYDTHELATGMNDTRLLIKYFVFLERYMIKFSDIVINANPERGKLLKRMYKLKKAKMFVIRNFPDSFNEEIKPHEIIKDMDKKHIWLSMISTISEARPLKPFIEALKYNKNLRIIYFGGDGDKFLNIATKAGVLEQVKVVGYVNRNMLLKTLEYFDGSIVAFAQEPLNNKYCESNRVYEALNSGNIIIATPNPTLLFINENKYGYNVWPNHKEIKNLYEKINKSEINKMKMNVAKIKNTYIWKKNLKFLKEIYGEYQ
ncbi:glycosyltransferase [Candidatus Micrarchaeota archaeon]|nr:glycosyltransferase [Candidatus Micrarchaeota archaeon]